MQNKKLSHENTKRFFVESTGLVVLRRLGNVQEGLCNNCDFHYVTTPANGGYCEHACRKDTYKENALYDPYVDRLRNNSCIVTSCNMFDSKLKKVENPTTEIDLLKNQIFDFGFYVDYQTKSDLESGTYFCYSIVSLSTGENVKSGCPYNLVDVLSDFIKTKDILDAK